MDRSIIPDAKSELVETLDFRMRHRLNERRKKEQARALKAQGARLAEIAEIRQLK